jgi:hypothetical protein
MSNNKQSMKLYTEEQVKKMLEVCRDSDLYEHILTFEDILKTETPIELPSDEDIEKETLEETALSFLPHSEVEHDTCFIIGFEFGFKYVLNKIQGGNNEQQ